MPASKNPKVAIALGNKIEKFTGIKLSFNKRDLRDMGEIMNQQETVDNDKMLDLFNRGLIDKEQLNGLLNEDI